MIIYLSDVHTLSRYSGLCVEELKTITVVLG
ncbi:MAG: hypothetical protein J07HQW2_01715 [Haloquadratum walsbyi J07HQW2]|uniref:Uncharacterized protein n=1 Tax=Haloquadratum walsbyi J07HQW2 TaxID=1238425 RepID=U1MXQ6_9EURY|nr:MAG: hypothetical protein J07HQW2_01715 [Haloquadratum walsbyi J07HQW2]